MNKKLGTREEGEQKSVKEKSTGKHTSEIKTDSIFNNNGACSYCKQSYKAEIYPSLLYQTPFETKQQ